MSAKPLVHYKTVGEGPETLVLLHGMGLHSPIFEPLSPILSKEYKLVMIDRRGLGGSKDLAPSAHIPEHARDVADVLDKEGIEKAHVMGVSMGGTIAQQFARDFPNRVNKLVLTVSLSRLKLWQRAGLKVLPLIGGLGVYKFLAWLGPRQLDIGGPGSELFDRAVNTFKTMRLSMLGWEGRALSKFNSQPWLHELKMPCLIIAASRDQILDLSYSKKLIEGIPNSRMVVLNSGHGAIGSHKELVAENVLSFLKQ